MAFAGLEQTFSLAVSGRGGGWGGVGGAQHGASLAIHATELQTVVLFGGKATGGWVVLVYIKCAYYTHGRMNIYVPGRLQKRLGVMF